MGRRPRRNKVKRNHEIIGIITISLGIFSFLSIYTHSAGILGEDFRNVLFGLFGFVAYIIPFIIIFMGILTIIAYKKKTNPGKIAMVIFTIYSAVCLIHMLSLRYYSSKTFLDFIKDSYDFGQADGIGAGVLAAIPVYPSIILLGEMGTYVLFITFILIGLVVLTNLSLQQVGQNIGEKIAIKVKKERDKKLYVEELKEQEALQTSFFLPRGNSHTEIEEEDTKSLPHQEVKIVDFTIDTQDGTNHESHTKNHKDEKNSDDAESVDNPILNIDYQDKSEKQLQYKTPPLDLLSNPSAKRSSKGSKEDYKERAKILEETLASFGVSAKIIQISRGPAITRYELQPAPGIKVSRIVNLADDIALSMAASGVRIEAPIPGKAAIGVEVPNSNISPVMLREVLESDEFIRHPSKIAFCLGKDIAGKNIIADLEKMPHLLIAGATGSGKSVCINTLITSILYKATPEEVRFIMIDPKVVELNTYNGIPHLLIPVVTDPKKAAGALNWAIQEMTSRYKAFADKGVRDITRYNEMIGPLGEPKLPHIVVIIDELADLMMVAPHDVEDAICRLAQMARAAGIHLVIATQRPSVDVITGVIKANIPSRIAFMVSSQIDSRTILDIGGAEKLLGRGDMLFNPVGAIKPIRIQGAYVSEKEVESIVEYIKGQLEPDYNSDILEEIAASDGGIASDKDEHDDLLPTAIEMVLENEQASISMLQRRLRIGYARAARLIDEMEERGIVSGYDGSKPRKVLITEEDFERMFPSE
ncbi:MAG: DNA translocase FtsK 4TM domain-containing protein [Clostridia bacterium]|jgi:S-DNA-T family DNA segregation ATPase FtsK/SpoIIIE